MGCSASRLDGLPAVSLCHDRLHLLNESLRHSYAFADSHAGYLHSLRSFSPPLLSFLRQSSQIAAAPTSDSQPNSDTCNCKDNSNSNSNSSSEAPSPNREFSSSSSDSDCDFAAYPKYDSYGDDGGRAAGGGEFITVRSWITPSPPPSRTSAWDFLNFFDATPFERYEFVEKEKGEEGARKNRVEGAKSGRNRPDPTQKKAKSTNAGKKNQLEAKPKADGAEKKKDSCPKHGNVVNEKVDSGEEKKESAAKLMKELEIQFERAAESGNGVLSSLDAGKSRFFSKDSVFQGVSVKLFRSIEPSGFNGDSGVSTSNLSSTLNKLCMWEKKLYDEVKAEERLRIAYGKSCTKMKRILAEDGGAGTKAAADAVGATLRTLATQIKVGIQVIDRTSSNINKLREEELFPQITHLIQKLLKMWQSMAESHRAQLEAVSEAQPRHLLALPTNGKLSDEGLESAIQLKIEIQTWALSFASWVSNQKQCLKSLNGWLLKCLHPGEEETEHYPPVFALCDKWSNTLEALSEREVLDAVHVLLGALTQLLEEQQQPVYGEEQRVIADKEMERRLKVLEREEQRLRKLMVVHTHGIGIWKVFDRKTTDFEVGLKQVFQAMVRFAARNLEAYQQLHAQIEATRSEP